MIATRKKRKNSHKTDQLYSLLLGNEFQKMSHVHHYRLNALYLTAVTSRNRANC